jgi:hypothetical protein
LEPGLEDVCGDSSGELAEREEEGVHDEKTSPDPDGCDFCDVGGEGHLTQTDRHAIDWEHQLHAIKILSSLTNLGSKPDSPVPGDSLDDARDDHEAGEEVPVLSACIRKPLTVLSILTC